MTFPPQGGPQWGNQPSYPQAGYPHPGYPQRPPKKKTGLWIALGAVVVLLLGGGAYTAFYDPGFLVPKKQPIPRGVSHTLTAQNLMGQFAWVLNGRDAAQAADFLCESADDRNLETLRTEVLAPDRQDFKPGYLPGQHGEGVLWTGLEYSRAGAPAKIEVGLEKGPEGGYCVVGVFP